MPAGDTVHIVHTIPFFPRSGIYVMPDGRLATIDFEVLLRNEDQFLMAAEKAVADWCSEVLEAAKVGLGGVVWREGQIRWSWVQLGK